MHAYIPFFARHPLLPARIADCLQAKVGALSMLWWRLVNDDSTASQPRKHATRALRWAPRDLVIATPIDKIHGKGDLPCAWPISTVSAASAAT